MHKVDGQKYLYIRNGTYYFRKTIEEKYWPYFNNKQEIKKSLRTSNLQEAEVGTAFEKALCGWTTGEARERYGDGPKIKTLYKKISKVKFEGLDLSHLFED